MQLPKNATSLIRKLERYQQAVKDGRVYLRMQAVLLVLRGGTSGSVAAALGCTRQAVNKWVRCYFASGDPLTIFGLPTSRVEDMGNHYALRTQRAVFQQWKENVPWASAGQVTIANGGMIAQELGWLPGEAVQPESVR